MDSPEAADAAVPGRRDRAEIAALYVLAVVVYAVLGHRMPVPMVSPDEYTYGHLAQSIAHGDGLSWRGVSEPLRSALYVVVIAPAWLGGSTVSGYAVAKIIGAVLVCSVVFPTWLLTRRITGQRPALLVAALVVAGPSLILAGEILTENLAYPLATWSLVSAVLALRRPSSRWGWAALGFAVAAAAARAQLIVLVPILVLVPLADAARHGAGWRRALVPHRRLLIAAGGLTLLGLVAILVARSSTLGSYAGVKASVPLTRLLAALGHQLVGLVTSLGIVPAVVVLAVSARRVAWRDPWLGPLLAVLWPATLVIVLESAVAVAGFNTAWHIERYVVYLLPLAIIVSAAALVRGLLSSRAAAIAGAALAAAMLFAPGDREVEEELSTYALTHLGDRLFGLSAQLSLVLATLAAGLAVVAALRASRPTSPAGRTAALAGALGVALLVLSGPAWTWKTDIARGWRSAFPSNLAWTDDEAGAPLARLIGAANASVFEVGEFFNRDIGTTLVPQTPIGGRIVRGGTCVWSTGADGTLTVAPSCGAAPRRFYLDDFYAKFTFYDQRVVVDRPPVARVVAVPAAARLRAEFFPACGPPLPILDASGSGPTVAPPRRACQAGAIGGRFWLDRPATLVLRWRGGSSDQQAAIGQRVYNLPARRLTTIRLPVPARPVSFGMRLGWRGVPPAVPALLSARLDDADIRTELLY